MVNSYLKHFALTGNYGISNYIKENPDIDLLEAEGLYFETACLRNHANILKALIKYYIKKNLRGDSKSIEYLYANRKLSNVLKRCSDLTDNTDKINALLSEYIISADSVDDYEQDLEGFDIPSIEN